MRRQFQTQPRNPMNVIQQNVTRNSATVTNSTGNVMAERPSHIKREVERCRRMMQEKYALEAAAAEEKRKEKEKKKREEWLKKQEALIRPGIKLGHGKVLPNLQRDLEEHQEVAGFEENIVDSNQQLMNDQYNSLVQQRIHRGREAKFLNRNIEETTGTHQANLVGAKSWTVGQISSNVLSDREQMLAARLRMQEKYNAELENSRKNQNE